jgi:hypothetical protein
MEKNEVRSPAAVIIFTMITCGIYGLVWVFKFSREIKNYLNKEEVNPGLEVLLCLVCFPYAIYWSYKFGKLMMEAQQKAGLTVEDNSILYLVLACFGLIIINMAIMQESANKIWEKQVV